MDDDIRRILLTSADFLCDDTTNNSDGVHHQVQNRQGGHGENKDRQDGGVAPVHWTVDEVVAVHVLAASLRVNDCKDQVSEQVQDGVDCMKKAYRCRSYTQVHQNVNRIEEMRDETWKSKLSWKRMNTSTDKKYFKYFIKSTIQDE